ncbi:SusC/RagA family TonB-linked outer membrane protein [Flammeovirga aprica]|uniref:SusC/RagA family TonB-linked outer membrane protein n=1 Tax=Flammeovirga aprica JL-4 TaxID=694437 RepID=A0A7X9NZC4_9BACT|nr:SusC/RagA family TonB-linked outer membrane protein [Flammeovirga aprica]NME66711.1 SusC/RagA family TonB-linked outer membrane protein [Flammeovirga aprica JL-4]
MKKYLLMLLSVLVMQGNLLAQEKVVTGTVKDITDGSALPGVNVLVKGTASGTVTDLDGKFSISLTDDQNTLVFSFIGYTSKEVDVSSASDITVDLEVDAEELEEVVVTALGIERSERSLGYAMSEVDSEELGSAGNSANVMNSLSGKVAGVQVAPVSGGAGSSSRVVIRGNAVLSGNNQPLYVVDGVPISNNQVKDAGDSSDSGDVNTGDGLSSINPDDIESMSVLKGGSATALYGSRAINGVVLITTKSGTKGKALGVDFNVGVTFDALGITPKDQKTYAQGTNGTLPPDSDPKSVTSMWGPKINGQSMRFFDGVTRPVGAYDNYRSFFNTGRTWNTNVALTSSNDKSTVRFSYGNMDSKGQVDHSTYKRNTFNLRGKTKMINDKLSLDARVTYVNQQAHNRLEMGNSVNNYMANFVQIPNTIKEEWLKNYKDPTTGRPIGYNNDDENPYWTLNEVVNEDKLDRIIGMVSLTYEFTDYLKLMGRGGTDYSTFRQNVLQPLFTPRFSQGRAFERTNLDRENNFDFLLMFHKQFGDFDITANAGGAYMHKEVDYTDSGSENFTAIDFQNPLAGSSRFQDFRKSERAIASVYGTASVGYKGYLFLDVSARNDWSSTLPLNNNSFFYPSLSASWIFSDMDWTMPDWFSFGKVRASVAQVGSDTDPYKLNLRYGLDGWNHNGVNIGNVEGGEIPNSTLKPAIQTSYEVGIDLRFFENRFGLDFAWYKSSSVNQILGVDISKGSGFERALINAGQIDNSGIELMLNYMPIQNDNFSWDITLNMAYNDNEVVSLTEGVNSFQLLSLGSVSVQAIPGEAYGVIVGKKFKRHPDSNSIIVDDSGRPVADDGVHIIGNGVQPWMAGLRNSFTYKNVSFSFLIDSKWGGEIYSSTESNLYNLGKHESTLTGRDEFYDPNQTWNPGGLVREDGSPFTDNIDPEQYYGAVAGISEHFIYDASFVKLREVTLSYRFSKELLGKTPIRNLTLSANAFNLFYLWRNTDNIDPESSFTSGNGQGIEFANLTIPRTFGFKLNANF